MRVAQLRTLLLLIAVGEIAVSVSFYGHAAAALGAIGRIAVDPVIARQYALYLASAALAYALAGVSPRRYLGIVWVCVVQRAVEFAVAVVDWRVHALSTVSFASIAALEIGLGAALAFAARGLEGPRASRATLATADRGLVRLLRAFGGLEVFWFLASSVFVQLGARLLGWKLQDAYTTQQQGIALLVIGLVSLVAASDVARYRLLVWVPVASQLIGIANAFNEIHLGSIAPGVAAVQWAIESTIVLGFVWFSRGHFRRGVRQLTLESNAVATSITSNVDVADA